MSETPLSIYFAGELFSFKHLLGNAALAEAIERVSAGKLRCVVPQTLEQRETSPLAIRNQDLAEVVRCDLGLFNFDGPEVDSGTVVEFMVAKFLDIPSLIIRSDFRRGGDGGEPWNLMMSGYPRTKSILVDSIAIYQKELHASTPSCSSVEASYRALERVAALIVSGFAEVVAIPPVISSEQRDQIYRWFASAAGSDFSKIISPSVMSELVKLKVERGLL